MADRCHAYGAKVSIQLQHAGPEGNSKLTGYPLKAASAIAPSDGREIPEAMPAEEVYSLIECYGDAARRAQLAGIDMVEVHCAHGYLVSTFVSARTNKRTDEFGGCFENRMRLPRLIIENIRRKTGGNLPILCRINARDEGDGGMDVHDAAAMAAYLEQECGVDAIHVSRSIHIHDEFMWAPNITHGGFNAELCTEIKRAVSVPVIIVGRFTEPQYAELLVKQGRADLVAFGRQSIADPELPNKARNGQLEKLTPCIACLLGCVPNMLKGNPITCAMNPCVGRESELEAAEVSKNVVVIGGGPGGLYAAAHLRPARPQRHAYRKGRRARRPLPRRRLSSRKGRDLRRHPQHDRELPATPASTSAPAPRPRPSSSPRSRPTPRSSPPAPCRCACPSPALTTAAASPPRTCSPASSTPATACWSSAAAWSAARRPSSSPSASTPSTWSR